MDIDYAARLASIATMRDLNPGDCEDEQRALSRADVLVQADQVLSMLDRQVRDQAAATLAVTIFPLTSASTAETLVRGWLDTSRLTVLTEHARNHVAAAFAHAWYPQTNPR